MYKTFVIGILLGLGVAGAATYSIEPVDLHRESSYVTVRANGGKLETFRINLPRDRIMIGLAGADNALPAGLDWPDEKLVGQLQAEMFKVRDRNDVVIGVASRIAATGETPFVEWALHMPRAVWLEYWYYQDIRILQDTYSTLKANIDSFELFAL